MSILVVGSVALDTVETPAGSVRDVLGGSATYFAWAASFFAPVQVVAPVGEDFPGEHVETLKERGIDISHLERRPGSTFRWHGRYGEDPDERETVAVCADAFSDFHPRLSESGRKCGYLFLANVDPGLQREVLEQADSPELVAMDTMDLWIKSQREAVVASLGTVDMLLVNDCEALELSGKDNLVKAAAWLRGRGPGTVIIKKGQHGALAQIGDSFFCIPGYPVAGVVDPTGAGDAFGGGVIGCLAESGKKDEEAMRKAVVCGSVMGSFAVEAFSLDRLMGLGREDVDRRYEEFVELVRF